MNACFILIALAFQIIACVATSNSPAQSSTDSLNKLLKTAPTCGQSCFKEVSKQSTFAVDSLQQFCKSKTTGLELLRCLNSKCSKFDNLKDLSAMIPILQSTVTICNSITNENENEGYKFNLNRDAAAITIIDRNGKEFFIPPTVGPPTDPNKSMETEGSRATKGGEGAPEKLASTTKSKTPTDIYLSMKKVFNFSDLSIFHSHGKQLCELTSIMNFQKVGNSTVSLHRQAGALAITLNQLIGNAPQCGKVCYFKANDYQPFTSSSLQMFCESKTSALTLLQQTACTCDIISDENDPIANTYRFNFNEVRGEITIIGLNGQEYYLPQAVESISDSRNSTTVPK
ncbi:hypothetical protein BCR33DRAFT_739972 [Rhizoclosmatium globosum]|uniref:Extracellular membrane protein CFEM domain-containing protein n=1 Tax=Rhizoclosmatium globosum TaxID=329046 RepID=A0A1Y2C1U1_9FUNG|nr:hypothetical protein BCR33DRAFT_739972 [Rhizoclosmatium globosum]|eukprot:ORY40998.1 hypothetical protein BCR33DRAFT_739972 [Rhizoclosmatium globosum]